MAGSVEERDVTLDQIKSGIQLKAGHEVVLVVDGAKGRDPFPGPAEDGDDPDDDSTPAEASSGGDDSSEEDSSSGDDSSSADAADDKSAPDQEASGDSGGDSGEEEKPAPAGKPQTGESPQEEPAADVQRLEVEDEFFNTASALLLPSIPGKEAPAGGDAENVDFADDGAWAGLKQSQPSFADNFARTPFDPGDGEPGAAARDPGLSVILAALKFQEAHADHALIVAGHTDRQGGEDYNQRLSEARANAVLAVLTGDKDGFVNACADFHADDDVPIVLAWAARQYGWDDDLKAFQAGYNEKFGGSIAVDGVAGNETRGAIFDLYQDELAALAGGADALKSLRDGLRFADPAHKILACGERYPIENPQQDGYKSQLNRRVELLFCPDAIVPDLGGDEAAERIYGQKKWKLSPLDRDDLAPGTAEPRGGGGGSEAEETLAIADAEPPEGEEELVTELEVVDVSDPDDAWAFLDAFTEPQPEPPDLA